MCFILCPLAISVSYLILRSLSYLEFILYGMRDKYFVSSTSRYLTYPHHLLKIWSFLLCIFWPICQKSGDCRIMDLYQGLLLNFMICLLLCQYMVFLPCLCNITCTCNQLVVTPAVSILFVRVFLWLWGSFLFPHEF